MKDYIIEDGKLYRVNYDLRGYNYEEFVYKEDLIDRLEELCEALINFVKVEE